MGREISLVGVGPSFQNLTILAKIWTKLTILTMFCRLELINLTRLGRALIKLIKDWVIWWINQHAIQTIDCFGHWGDVLVEWEQGWLLGD